MNPTMTRGTVWWVDLPMNPDTHIQGGMRPCVVVSTGYCTTNSGVITVCPLSTKLDAFPFHPKVFAGNKPGQILVEQIVTVDLSQIDSYVGVLSEPDLAAFNKSLSLCFGEER